MQVTFRTNRLARAAMDVSSGTRFWGPVVARRYMQRVALLAGFQTWRDACADRSLRLHPLHGKREGLWAVDLVGRWRIEIERKSRHPRSRFWRSAFTMAIDVNGRIWGNVAFHPGEHLAEELAARGKTQSQLAKEMGRPFQVINGICNQRKAITAETAVALERVLGISASTWMTLQCDYELTLAYLRAEKRGEVPPAEIPDDEARWHPERAHDDPAAATAARHPR